MKFKIGDKARVKYVRNGEGNVWKAGAIIEITKIQTGISFVGNPVECRARCSDGSYSMVIFAQLEPIVPPKEETSWEKVHEIIGWKPEEVTV